MTKTFQLVFESNQSNKPVLDDKILFEFYRDNGLFELLSIDLYAVKSLKTRILLKDAQDAVSKLTEYIWDQGKDL